MTSTKSPRFAVRSIILTLVTGAFILCGSSTMCRADDAGDTAYPIKLFRPFHVGEKYELSAKGSQKIRIEILDAGKSTLSDQNVAAQLEGTIEVVAVDSKGSAIKLSCTVKKFTRTDGKEPVELLSAGAVVFAESVKKTAPDAVGHETRFTLKEGEVTPEQKTALGVVLEATSPESATDDEISGSDKPQKVGAVWSMNSAKAAEEFKNSDVFVDPADLTGQCTLARTEVGGKPYLQVKTEISGKNLKAPGGALKMEATKLEGKFSGLIVGDSAPIRNAQVQDFSILVRAKATGPQGEIATVNTIVTLHKETECRPIR